MKAIKIALVAAMTATLVLAAGCGPALVRVEQPLHVEEKAVELGAAQALDARLTLGVGELRVDGGTDKAMQAKFDYRNEALRPSVTYSVEGTTGQLTVEQHELRPTLSMSGRNVWQLLLNDTVPLDLTVDRGVGDGTLELGRLDLRRLMVRGGAGDSVIDLGTTPRRDLAIDITGGVGTITVRVPKQAAVRVRGYEDGVGKFTADGFAVSNAEGAYVNAAYGTPGAKVYDIRLQRGVGDVNIEQQ